MSTIATTIHRVEMTDVRDIVISDIVQLADGSYLRTVRFFGDPVDGTTTPLLLLETVSRSNNRADLVIDTPAAGF